jgi:hypothetical protein
MAAFLIPVAVWGFNAYRVYRLAQMATTAAGAVRGASVIMSAANNASQDLDDKQTRAEVCSTCEPPPECKDLENAMRNDAETIHRRIEDMKIDQHSLFDKHYYEWQRHPQLGSWKGHERQIKQVQKSLENKRKESEILNCPKPSSNILQWLRSNAPTAPRGR